MNLAIRRSNICMIQDIIKTFKEYEKREIGRPVSVYQYIIKYLTEEKLYKFGLKQYNYFLLLLRSRLN
jgi:hypothetical protein